MIRHSTPAQFSKTAITDVRVFNGSCFSLPRTVIIDKNLLSSNATGIATTVNGTGLFLIPGLIDSHIHTSSVEALENATSYGITTTMNMACQNYTLCKALRGHPGLSDFKTAGFPAIGPNSSHAAAQHLLPSQLVTDASNATDLVSIAKTNASNYFKITLERNGPSYDLSRRLIAAAHAQGLPTMGHASDVNAYQQAADTGIDGIQHVPRDSNLTEAVIQQIKTNGQFVTPTLAIFAAALHPPNPAIIQFLGAKIESSGSAWATVIHNTREMYRAGIPLLAGTDAVGPITPSIFIPYGATLHQEMELLVEEIGMSPAEAINAATVIAAKYHSLHDRGVIRDGMRADLLLLHGDPLEDIKNTRDVVAVWAAGRRYAGPLTV